jgi:hypothetical protein
MLSHMYYMFQDFNLAITFILLKNILAVKSQK